MHHHQLEVVAGHKKVMSWLILLIHQLWTRSTLIKDHHAMLPWWRKPLMSYLLKTKYCVRFISWGMDGRYLECLIYFASDILSQLLSFNEWYWSIFGTHCQMAWGTFPYNILSQIVEIPRAVPAQQNPLPNSTHFILLIYIIKLWWITDSLQCSCPHDEHFHTQSNSLLLSTIRVPHISSKLIARCCGEL